MNKKARDKIAKEIASNKIKSPFNWKKLFGLGVFVFALIMIIPNCFATAWDISTASFQDYNFLTNVTTNNLIAFDFNSDGTGLYAFRNNTSNIYQYTLSTAWDINSISYTGKTYDSHTILGSDAGTGFRISSDGTKAYIVNTASGIIYQLTLSTAWDISTSSSASKSKDVSTQGNPHGFTFNSNGTKLYTVINSSGIIYQYTLSIAWDISTASYDSKFYSVATQETEPYAMSLASDGTKMYVSGHNNSTVYQYTLSTAYDVSTASYESKSLATATYTSDTRDVYITFRGQRIYTGGYTASNIAQWNMGPMFFSVTPSSTTGTYFSAFDVTLTTDQPDSVGIYYTTDGTDPDNTDTEYSETITISETTILKAVSYDDTDYSEIMTETYTIREPITNITFYDENSLSAIPTVTITDANGSTYTSDINGLWVASLTGAKDLTISKTGYDSRKLQFYFNTDANYNFLLNPTGLDSNVDFLVTDLNGNVWNNKYLQFNIEEIIRNTDVNSFSEEIYYFDDNIVNWGGYGSYVLKQTFDFSEKYIYCTKATYEFRRASASTSYILVKFVYYDDTELSIEFSNSTSTYTTYTYTNTAPTKFIKYIKVYAKNDSYQDNWVRNKYIYFNGIEIIKPAIINSLLTDYQGVARASLKDQFVIPTDYNACAYYADGTLYTCSPLYSTYTTDLTWDENTYVRSLNIPKDYNTINNLRINSSVFTTDTAYRLLFNLYNSKFYQFYEFLASPTTIISEDLNTFKDVSTDTNNYCMINIYVNNMHIPTKYATVKLYLPDGDGLVYNKFGQRLTDSYGMTSFYIKANMNPKIVVEKNGYEQVVWQDETMYPYCGTGVNININLTEGEYTEMVYNTGLVAQEIDYVHPVLGNVYRTISDRDESTGCFIVETPINLRFKYYRSYNDENIISLIIRDENGTLISSDTNNESIYIDYNMTTDDTIWGQGLVGVLQVLDKNICIEGVSEVQTTDNEQIEDAEELDTSMKGGYRNKTQALLFFIIVVIASAIIGLLVGKGFEVFVIMCIVGSMFSSIFLIPMIILIVTVFLSILKEGVFK